MKKSSITCTPSLTNAPNIIELEPVNVELIDPTPVEFTIKLYDPTNSQLILDSGDNKIKSNIGLVRHFLATHGQGISLQYRLRPKIIKQICQTTSSSKRTFKPLNPQPIQKRTSNETHQIPQPKLSDNIPKETTVQTDDLSTIENPSCAKRIKRNYKK